MLLTINSQVPAWWVEANKPRTISQWWDGIEWRNYDVPDTFLSTGYDPLGGIITHSNFTHELFKFIAHSGDIMSEGFATEIMKVLGIW